MLQNNLTIVILAAGKGTRMKSALPKVCHTIGGLPMLNHVLNTATELKPHQIITVIAPDTPEVQNLIPEDVTVAIQESQDGTGHAVKAAMPALKDPNSDILVLYGDSPMLKASTLEQMLKLDADVIVMGMRAKEPHQYGRILMDKKGQPNQIIETKDAKPEHFSGPLANSGVMLISGQHRQSLLELLSTDNAQGEYLLTDVIRHAYEKDLTTACFEGEYTQLRGINDRLELARCEQDFQNRCRVKAMENGATLLDPHTVTFCHDTKIGQDVTIQPNVFFGPHVVIEDNVTILGHCHIEGAVIRSGCSVGPFARIRPGTILETKSKVGNFVEIKKSHLKQGAKVNHLSYIGDAEVGSHTNIGAGTITCNYDGYGKYKTFIGDHVFIGSNTALVAPLAIGEGAIIGAGSVITKDVDADAIAISRSDQKDITQGAVRFRNSKSAKKEAKEG